MSAVLKEQADFATQSGHWYEPDGTPRYTIIGANGKERNTTVRDAKKLGLVPSVTTILKMAAAPGLVRWQKEQVAKASYLQPPREGESEAGYLARILPLAEEVARKARDRGTEIHGAIEKWYQGKLVHEWIDWANCVGEKVKDWASPEGGWNSERSFATQLGFGGKLDLSAPGFVVDFKTTEKDLVELKLWPDHRRQLSAYRMGLDMPSARCAIVYVSSVKPEARLIELGEEELARGWEEFKALLALWKSTNKA